MKVSANIKEAITDIVSCANKKIHNRFILEDVNQTWMKARSKKEYCCFFREKPEPHYRLEVWRAHTVLNDYTVLDDKRKENVLNLYKVILIA